MRIAVVIATLALLAAPAAADVRAEAIEVDAGPLVVRVYYGSPERIPELFVYDLLEYRNERQGYVLVQVHPDEYLELIESTFRLEIDVDRTIQARRTPERLEGQFSGISGYPCYRTVEETYLLAQQIAILNPTLASWIDVGDSWQKTVGMGGYDLKVLKLTNSATPGPKPKLIVTASIHAREYTPAELSTRFAQYLIDGYGADADVTWILDYHEVHLLLQGNPDGRKQAELGVSWRKNTNTAYCGPTSLDRGADLNRNFSFQWDCCGGASDDACHELYRGPFAASEPEVQVIQAYLLAEFPDWRGPGLTDAAPSNASGLYIDNHSFSELVLWPWALGSTPAPNGAALQTLGRKFAHFNGYEPKQAFELYVFDGSVTDFAYGELGIATYTFELGTQFFQGCEAFEGTILPDNLAALVYAAKAARAPYLLPAGPDALDVGGAPAFVQPGDPLNLLATLDDTRFNPSHGSEPTQNIVAAEAYLNAPPWDAGAPAPLAMVAVDGTLDSPAESVRLDLDSTTLSGQNVVYVRGQDAAGNWGVVGAAYLYVADGTEGTLSGQVTRTTDGQPLAASVRVDELNLTVLTDGAGFYSLDLPIGSFSVRALADGYEDSVVSDLVMAANAGVTQDFALARLPRLLIVDDDDNSPDVGSTYTQALDALGESYLMWDTSNSDTEPGAQDLESFDAVVWFAGDEVGGFAGPGAAAEAALATWLDRSGCLLLLSQDYHLDRGQTSFMGSHLGLTGVINGPVPLSAIGLGVFAGSGPYFFSFPYPNSADRLTPDVSAAEAVSSGSDPVAITKDTGVYRTSFWGFGLEGIPGQVSHQTLLAQWLGWCEELKAIDGDADGVANGVDCLAGDATMWSVPTPARELRVGVAPGAEFSWTAPLDIGGAGVVYDLLVAGTPAAFAAATCVAADLLGTTAEDPAALPPGTVNYYLVRARNACGGSLGGDSTGLDRLGPACN